MLFLTFLIPFFAFLIIFGGFLSRLTLLSFFILIQIAVVSLLIFLGAELFALFILIIYTGVITILFIVALLMSSFYEQDTNIKYSRQKLTKFKTEKIVLISFLFSCSFLSISYKIFWLFDWHMDMYTSIVDYGWFFFSNLYTFHLYLLILLGLFLFITLFSCIFLLPLRYFK